MKVDDPRTHFSLAVAKVDAAGQEPAVKKPSPTAGSDAVHLSSDLRLADDAVRAALTAGDVRPDAVAKARALLENGTLGRDLGKLADSLIDSQIESYDRSS